MANYIEQIASIESKIRGLENALPGLIESERAWRADSNVPCDSGTKKKKEACRKDKAWKKGKADQLLAQIKNYRAQISRLQKDKGVLEEAQSAQNEATVNLSTKGESLEALVIAADGEAKAAQQSASIEAQAKAAAIAQESAADVENKEQTNQVVLIIIVLVALIALGFGAMKLKKMANAKV